LRLNSLLKAEECLLGFKDGDGLKEKNFRLASVLADGKLEMWKNVSFKPFVLCVLFNLLFLQLILGAVDLVDGKTVSCCSSRFYQY